MYACVYVAVYVYVCGYVYVHVVVVTVDVDADPVLQAHGDGYAGTRRPVMLPGVLRS